MHGPMKVRSIIPVPFFRSIEHLRHFS